MLRLDRAGPFAITLLQAKNGQTFMLSAQPIWVRDVAMALTMSGAQ